ncbi:hypothetical protein H632_c283p0, partial [Helicosporidium sp. ATCC 50920]
MYCRSKDVSVIQWAPAAPGARRAVNFDVYLPAFPTSSVQQVVFPYLVATGSSENAYVPGTMVHGLNFNLLLHSRSTAWLSLPRANAMVAPLQPIPGTAANNLWKHAYVMPRVAARAVATIQTASLSARTLAQVNAQVKTNTHTLWPASVWGPVSILPGAQLPEGPATSPSSPASPHMPPAPPLPPLEPVDLMYRGASIASATVSSVPLVVTTDSTPEVVGFVDPADYPYTGSAYKLERGGQILSSVYVGERLVGFVAQTDASAFSVVSTTGYTYPVVVPPSPPAPPLPPSSFVSIAYGGIVIASTTDATIPAIVAGESGPEPRGDLTTSEYPYTGYTYEIAWLGQVLEAAYIGQQIVGFVPKSTVSEFTGFANGATYRL